MESNRQAKFHTLQLFVWRSAGPDSILDEICETDAANAHALKDVASDKITLGAGNRIELRAYDQKTTAPGFVELGKWDVVWDLPPRCRRERPCVIIDGTPVDFVRFVKERS